jgi:hypothetical protein
LFISAISLLYCCLSCNISKYFCVISPLSFRDENNPDHCTWEEFEKLFSDKLIRDTKMEEMYGIQDDLKETKEEIKKKGEDLSKIISLN